MKTYAGIGSRSTPPGKLLWIQRIATRLGEEGWILRSGAARGADTAFEKAAVQVGGPREIFRPNDATTESKAVAERYHPGWDRLDTYVRGLMGRNAQIILGACLTEPVDCVIGWTREGREMGGTGHSYRIARGMGIPIVDLARIDMGEAIPPNVPNAIRTAILATRPNAEESKEAVRRTRNARMDRGRQRRNTLV